MSDWKSAFEEWQEFLNQVEDARYEIDGLYATTWYRGQEEHAWPLLPTLLRSNVGNDARHDSEAETVRAAKTDLRDLLDEKTHLKKELTRLYAQGNAARAAATSDAYSQSTQAVAVAKRRVTAETQKAMKANQLAAGERELFAEFAYRAAAGARESSWRVLAQARHHGVPTRLLDWTESLHIALFFALRTYTASLEAEWRRRSEKVPHFFVPEGVTEPCVWILNPKGAGARSTGRPGIRDFEREGSYDYFDNLLQDETWPFEMPVPIYPPLRSPRIDAQRGSFTVHGYNFAPVEEQYSRGILRRISLSPPAAVFGVRYLRNFVALDDFAVFRDLDTLGSGIALYTSPWGSG